uniref:Uncharacterized protein n=1 Tax=Paramormyrops kingsleyae TaxID=1676925 RepID=A0A3B3Q389_9TELE
KTRKVSSISEMRVLSDRCLKIAPDITRSPEVPLADCKVHTSPFLCQIFIDQFILLSCTGPPLHAHVFNATHDVGTVIEELFCRICHEGGGAEQLLSPCECSGSLASVHRSCLERWLTASSTGRCELCRFEFALERQPRPLTEWLHAPSMRYQRRTLCGDALCFTFITPLASLSGWLCVRGAVDLYHSSSMEAAGLLVLTAALLVIYLFWTTVSLRYHVHLFEMWRQTNQQVRLQIPQPEGLPCGRLEPPPRPSSKDPSKETVV